MPIKVLIVDDSAIVRTILEKGLSLDKDIEVVGTAPDVYTARDKIVLLNPDVITLDVEMPKMNGVDFLKRLMPQYPKPVVMVSSLTKNGSQITIAALEAGAVDFVLKPTSLSGNDLSNMLTELIAKIKIAAKTDVSKFKRENYVPSTLIKSKKKLEASEFVLAIGASTGGTVALTDLVKKFDEDIWGTVVVQHMPPVFTQMFADRLNQLAKVEVREAKSGDRVEKGLVLIAPGGFHLTLHKDTRGYFVMCEKGEKVNGFCPSVDVLFESVAKVAKSNAIGVILTGMGNDGAAGMLKMRLAGARTLAQDEESSVVFGMPKEAYKNGGAEKLVHIDRMYDEIVKLMRNYS